MGLNPYCNFVLLVFNRTRGDVTDGNLSQASDLVSA